MTSSPPTRPALAIVLAAGKGTRMKSELPKVLVPVAGRPMIRYVIDAIKAAGVEKIVVVVGYMADLVRQELAGDPTIEFAEQREQLGTGHAVMMCREQLDAHSGPVFIVAGDSPLLQAQSVRTLLSSIEDSQAACLLGTVERVDPQGFGRVVRDIEGNFVGIVEEKDADESQRTIREVNVSTYVFNAVDLLASLDSLTNKNVQGEYYITDCPAVLLAGGKKVDALPVLDECEALSINSMKDLAEVEAELERQAQSDNQSG